ncbi:hypothetical protein [Mycobacterium sp. IDR2000157661]|uniref:hypothetical protein n=1 Tax=Mycobacterium sp. IDR2000157661 TaxID=2867005 RepID=UPI001EEBA4A4|nr:hypothetical protein [Mycobacterium sp. IDR2000157661]
MRVPSALRTKAWAPDSVLVSTAMVPTGAGTAVVKSMTETVSLLLAIKATVALGDILGAPMSAS